MASDAFEMVELDYSLLRLHLKHFKSSTRRNSLIGVVEHFQKIDLGILDAFYYDFRGIRRVPKGQNQNLTVETARNIIPHNWRKI